MNKKKAISNISSKKTGALFNRIVEILDSARIGVVRSVNNHMVIAYWLIGKEIVEALQQGENRAEYGKNLIEEISQKLTQEYGKGFSATNT